MDKRKKLVLQQIELFNTIYSEAKVNIVTCGHCGTVLLHKVNEESTIDCYSCSNIMDKCDCPDFWYTNAEESLEFDETAIKNNAMQTHNNLREVLIEYGSEEFGDCIIDEICNLFNYPDTNFFEEKEKEEEIAFTFDFLNRKLDWGDFCDITGVSYYAKKEGHIFELTEIFKIKKSVAKTYNLI